MLDETWREDANIQETFMFAQYVTGNNVSPKISGKRSPSAGPCDSLPGLDFPSYFRGNFGAQTVPPNNKNKKNNTHKPRLLRQLWVMGFPAQELLCWEQECLFFFAFWSCFSLHEQGAKFS